VFSLISSWSIGLHFRNQPAGFKEWLVKSDPASRLGVLKGTHDTPPVDYDVIIIGAGAAGLFCALTAGRRGRRVLLIEHNERIGKKILISGGGRCNFTNLTASHANYVTSGSPHFAKSALARFGPQDFLSMVDHHGIRWHEKKLGQLFCDQSSKEIVEMLEAECADARVDIELNCRTESVRLGSPGSGGRFEVSTSRKAQSASSLVIATGGLSFPKLGATSFGHQIAAQFEIPLVPLRPGLVPLTFSAPQLASLGGLSGLSIDCSASAGVGLPSFRENLLFTHRGLSGPAILQISSYWKEGNPIRLNLLPDMDLLEHFRLNRTGGKEMKNVLRQLLPDRFVQTLFANRPMPGPVAQMPQRELELLAQQLHAWELTPGGDEGYPKAEVTVGGVSTGEISSKSMECRKVPGLFFIGEVVDVTGWLGGYNFQWAWASGHAAGSAA
jgi:predicted Rossmann fold flavoprotein